MYCCYVLSENPQQACLTHIEQDLCQPSENRICRNSLGSQKVVIPVTPAKAGVQKLLNKLDSRLRGNDMGKTEMIENGVFQTFTNASIV